MWMQMFDSVGKYFRICEVLVPNLIGYGHYDEFDLPPQFSTPSLNYVMLQALDLEDLQVRQKHNGSPLWRYEDSTGVYLVGMGRKFDLDGDSEVGLIEYTEDGLISIHGDNVITGVDICSHPYCPLSQRKGSWSEGMVVQVNGCDYKVKVNPTVEVLGPDDVAWEACIVKGNWKMLRPRPGKTYLPDIAARNLIAGYVSMAVFDAVLVVRPIEVKQSVPVGDVVNVLVDNTPVVRSRLPAVEAEVVGSKVLLYEGDMSFLLREKNKGLDLVGGKVEVGETSEEALMRESVEETGQKVVMAKKVGVVERVVNGTKFTTYLYVAPMARNKGMRNLEGRPFSDLDGAQPWVKTYYEFIRSLVGPYGRIHEYWGRITATAKREVVDVKQHVPVSDARAVLVEILEESGPTLSTLLRKKVRDRGAHIGRPALMRLCRENPVFSIDNEGRIALAPESNIDEGMLEDVEVTDDDVKTFVKELITATPGMTTQTIKKKCNSQFYRVRLHVVKYLYEASDLFYFKLVGMDKHWYRKKERG